MQGIFQWFTDSSTAILAVMFFISEAMAQIPGIKSNSIFQLIAGWLSKFAPKP